MAKRSSWFSPYLVKNSWTVSITRSCSPNCMPLNRGKIRNFRLCRSSVTSKDTSRYSLSRGEDYDDASTPDK